MMKLLMLFAALVVGLFTMSAASAQGDAVILQISVPFFLEDAMQPIIDQYEADNPGVQVQMVAYQGFGMPVDDDDDAEIYQDNLVEYFSSADILFIDSDLSPEATRGGHVLDLMPITRSDPDYTAIPFNPGMADSFIWDNGQWALPVSTDFIVLEYIPAAFDAAGLSYPNESWTMVDLDFAARTLTQTNDDGSMLLPGLFVQGGGDNFAALMLSASFGSVFTDATLPSSPDFSNPQLAENLEIWRQMLEDGLFIFPEEFDNNEVPIVIGNPGGFGGPFGGQDSPETAAALLPGGRAGLNATGYAISAGTLYPQEAYDFAKHLMTHPNSVNFSLGTVAAVEGLEPEETEGFGPGFFNATIPDALQPILDFALQSGLTVSEARFADGIQDAFNLMTSESLDAVTALNQIQSEYQSRLVVADNRAVAGTPLAVNPPDIAPELAADEVALRFATLGGGPGGGGGGGFAFLDDWQAKADDFAALDPAVGAIEIEQEPGFQANEVALNYDCFYAGTNLVPDADLTLLLNFDPLIFADPAFDQNDFISGVFDQVRVDNQVWALPLQISPLVMRFDSDALNQAGVVPPTGAWDIFQFEEALRNLRFIVGEDQAPLDFDDGSQSALITLIAAYGGLPFDTRTDPPTINFSDPATVSAVQQVLTLVKEGYISYELGGGPGGGGGGGGGGVVSVQPMNSDILNITGFGGGGFGGGGGGGGGPQSSDGIMAFPRGNQFNAVAFNLGTAYISAATPHVEACYRFISYVANSVDLFQSMPPRYSLINSPDLAATQGPGNIAFFSALAALLEDPTTIAVPTNLNADNFGMTQWFFDVFDRYLEDEVLDLNIELQDAEQITRDYLTCVNAIPPLVPDEDGFQAFFDQIVACQAAVDPAT